MKQMYKWRRSGRELSGWRSVRQGNGRRCRSRTGEKEREKVELTTARRSHVIGTQWRSADTVGNFCEEVMRGQLSVRMISFGGCF